MAVAVETPGDEGGVESLQSEEQKRLVLRRRRRDQVEYLKKHRTKLEKVAQRCVNRVLLQLPRDPYEGLLIQLSAHVKASGLFFKCLRILSNGADSLVCEVAAVARGTQLVVHRADLPRLMVARGLAAAKAPEAMSLADAEALDISALVQRWSSAVGNLLAGVNVLDFEEINRRLCDAVPLEPEEGDEETDTKPIRDAASVLRAMLAGVLLEAAGRLMDCSAREAIRAGILLFGGVGDEPEDEEGVVAPPISCQTDLETWQHQWPEVVLPVLNGSTARRRLSLGVTLWAATLPEAKVAIGNGSPWELELVDEAAEQARLTALADIPPDADEDEAPAIEPHEYCPPMNAVSLAAELGLAITTKAGAGAALPAGENFAEGLVQMRHALDAMLPKHTASEKAFLEAAAEAAAEGAAGAAAKPAPIKQVHDDDNDEDLESVASEKKALVPLAEVQRRGCVYFVLHADADAAFNEEACTYSFAEGTTMTQAEIVEYYVDLCAAEPLLKLLVAPLSPRDLQLEEGLLALRTRLPTGVIVADEESSGEASQIEEEFLDEELFGDEEAGPELHLDRGGRLRDTRLTSLGLAVQRQRPVAAARGKSEAAVSLLGRHAVYDFGHAEVMLPAIGFLMDAVLALPDSSRRIVMPKCSSAEELVKLLHPVDVRLRSLLLSAYRQKRASNLRGKNKNLNRLQFREGLRRLGYADTDEHAEIIFSFLDQSKDGTLTPSELQMLELVDGPASQADLDELRIWLCAWKARRMAAKAAKLEAEHEADRPPEGEAEKEAKQEREKEEKRLEKQEQRKSPLMELWQYMDKDGSGEASFAEWMWALRKARHPVAFNPSRGPALELFMCLDIQVDGSIVEGEFFCLNILSAYYQLTRVERVRDFLQERFGSLKAAFKFMDEDRSGSLTTEEWLSIMMGPQGYPCEEDIRVCFIFIDKDFSGELTNKEFEFLGNFDGREFAADVSALCEHLVEKYENLEDAYTAFEQRIPPPGPDEDGPKDWKLKKKRMGKGLAAQDFVNGGRLAGFKGKFDLRLHFNFLDAAHVGNITKNEFLQLGKLGVVEFLHTSSERMRRAIASMKGFVLNDAELEAADGANTENDSWKWAAVHQAMKDATFDDLDLM